jgi:DNA replication protein DnaC
MRRVVHILLRRTKNNPVLVGEPGVGKTAIAEGLAQRIVAGESLANRCFFLAARVYNFMGRRAWQINSGGRRSGV